MNAGAAFPPPKLSLRVEHIAGSGLVDGSVIQPLRGGSVVSRHHPQRDLVRVELRTALTVGDLQANTYLACVGYRMK
jgi:hypothetical protein